ncbi:Lrp/AsnC family transcriptional regulator [Candidatus Pacearchaeota archaeon]|nr:Lrp/AsnC family transcriptional regulator [Candidatus Pacearchaeota archaeon]
MVDLSSADKKILNLIEYNPRVSYKELAKACHLSKDTMKYRLARLEKESVILGYTCFIDYKKIGHQSYKLYLKLNGTIEEKNELKEYLRKQKNVFATFDSIGNWNIAIAIFAKTHEEFNQIENGILAKFGSFISNRRFCSMIDVELYQKDFFHENTRNYKSFNFWGNVEENKLDEKDRELIKILHTNSRESLVDISAKIKLSIDAVKNRIKRLRERKIVEIYRTSINYSLLGYDQYKLLIYPRSYSDKTEEELRNFLRSKLYCINFMRTIGPWKLEIEFLSKKPSEVEEILSELNEKFKMEILDLELSVLRNEELFACKDLLLE